MKYSNHPVNHILITYGLFGRIIPQFVHPSEIRLFLQIIIFQVACSSHHKIFTFPKPLNIGQTSSEILAALYIQSSTANVGNLVSFGI